jgi:hypothetical protein
LVHGECDDMIMINEGIALLEEYENRLDELRRFL